MKQYKIIIVENDEDEQLFMREEFEKSGLFDIMTISKNGDVLFEWLNNHPDNLPDIILSDLNMPGKNGYDIISEVKANERLSSIPVIITSTSSTRSTIARCLELGASDYIVKPDTFIEYGPFVEKLHRLLEERRLVK
jgi:CheY-like chemotaxis protein